MKKPFKVALCWESCSNTPCVKYIYPPSSPPPWTFLSYVQTRSQLSFKIAKIVSPPVVIQLYLFTYKTRTADQRETKTKNASVYKHSGKYQFLISHLFGWTQHSFAIMKGERKRRRVHFQTGNVPLCKLTDNVEEDSAIPGCSWMDTTEKQTHQREIIRNQQSTICNMPPASYIGPIFRYLPTSGHQASIQREKVLFEFVGYLVEIFGHCCPICLHN